jgi:hypothetical protein
MKREAKAIYLHRKHGWFWVVPFGNNSIYWGPYKDEATAKREGPKDDLADQIPSVATAEQ